MTNLATNQRVGFDTERSRASTTFNGTNLAIGSPLEFNPVVIVFDNQSDVSVPLYVNGSAASNLWKTFPAGEAFVLDLRANNGLSPFYSIDIGTLFSTNAAVGTTGNFSIAIIYAR